MVIQVQDNESCLQTGEASKEQLKNRAGWLVPFFTVQEEIGSGSRMNQSVQ